MTALVSRLGCKDFGTCVQGLWEYSACIAERYVWRAGLRDGEKREGATTVQWELEGTRLPVPLFRVHPISRSETSHLLFNVL